MWQKRGTTLAVAHGGWSSDAHERDERFDLNDVMDLSSEIVVQEDEHDSDASFSRVPVV